MKNIIKIVIYVLVIFLIFYNIVLVIKKVSNPTEIPDFLGYKSFIVLSGSMESTLNIGDIIFVKEKEINEQDIIAFSEKNSTVTHRVIKIIEENGITCYKTKGDANTEEDRKLVSNDEVEGVYCFKIPKVGKVVMFFQTKFGIFVFLGTLLIIYLIINRNFSNDYE